MRKHVWKNKVAKRATQALFLAKYVLNTQENTVSEKDEAAS